MQGTKSLYLPETARPESASPIGAYSEVAAEHRQMLEELEDVTGKMAYYERELRTNVDEHLRIMMAKPTVSIDGLKPGYYHIVRLRPGHPAYIKVVENPDGTWRDLDSYVFTLVGEDDLWNDRLQREKNQKRRKAEEARQRDKQRAAQERAAEFDDRLKHAMNTQILVTKDIH